MRFSQLAQTDSLFQFFDLSWMNDSLLTGLCLTFFHNLDGCHPKLSMRPKT